MAIREELKKLREELEEERRALDERIAQQDRAMKRSYVVALGMMAVGATAGYVAGVLRLGRN